MSNWKDLQYYKLRVHERVENLINVVVVMQHQYHHESEALVECIETLI